MKARNPSTGNLETVYVKALDSMPVGSVVDFTGSSADVPAGWEEVYDYSTTEIDTGKKWINGKPIYRKVIVLPTLVDAIENSWTTITSVSDLNISTLTDFKYISTNNCAWSGLISRINNNNLEVYNKLTTWAIKTLIVEYTKSN